MKLFVFGAGASRGSQRDASIPPYQKSPLVDEIFDRTYRDYSDSIGLSSNVMQEFENKAKEVKSVEKLLTERWDAISKIESEHKKTSELKIFGGVTSYLRWLFQNVSETYNRNSNLYKNFLDKLDEKGEHFGIINFNYDTLLDRAFEDAYGPFVRLEDYFELRYVKPHGSVNWFLRRRDGDRTFPVHEQTPNIRGRYDLVNVQMYIGSHNFGDLIVRPAGDKDLNNLNFIRSEQFQSQYFYPLIILPLITKQFQNVIGFERIIDECKKLMKLAKDIYLIGYRAKDEIMREMFKEANEKTYIHVINLVDAQSIMNELTKLFPHFQTGGVHHAGFSNYVEEYLRTGLI